MAPRLLILNRVQLHQALPSGPLCLFRISIACTGVKLYQWGVLTKACRWKHLIVSLKQEPRQVRYRYLVKQVFLAPGVHHGWHAADAKGNRAPGSHVPTLKQPHGSDYLSRL